MATFVDIIIDGSVNENEAVGKLNPIQVPQVRNGEQVLQSLSLWSCE